MLHVPPDVVSDTDIVEPTHKALAPVIGAGIGFTTTDLVAKQPVGMVYEISVVPAVVPETVPADAPDGTTVATEDTVLLHVPPAVPSLSIVLDPAHIGVVPTIGIGVRLTDTVRTDAQPVAKV